jgi:hypothetical protein
MKMDLISKLPDNVKKALNQLALAIFLALAGIIGAKLGQTPPPEPVILQVEPGTMKIVKVIDAKEIKEKP